VRRDLERLNDILTAIEKACGRADASEEAFLRDEMLQVWMIHHLQ